jgi:hypothetical protein
MFLSKNENRQKYFSSQIIIVLYFVQLTRSCVGDFIWIKDKTIYNHIQLHGKASIAVGF